MANATFEIAVFGLAGHDVYIYATGLDQATATGIAAFYQKDSVALTYVVRPSVVTDEGLDDWEGPEALGYSESDPEAFDEMVRDDMAGRF